MRPCIEKLNILTCDGNPAIIVEMGNLSLKYSSYYYAIDRVNGKVYTITVGGWILVQGNASVPPFPSVSPVAGS